ncbi:hypothetical protein RDI58_024552 [Solanum bulbocastanum]|uniref:Uncharacterized protein n=1 Tax=Solanum bulbocastanum TaxID=147425 RepID=A0AAN8Y3G1_SOLBU
MIKEYVADMMREKKLGVVLDNLPLYCTNCKNQGHEDADCRLMIQENKRGEGNHDDIGLQDDKTNKLEQLQDNASNVNGTLNINSLQYLTTENSGDTRLVLVVQRLMQEELLVPRTKVQEGFLVPGQITAKDIKKIGLQENTTNLKAFVVASQVASGKLLTEDNAINTAATFVAQIKELGQSNTVDKAGVTIDVGAQIGSPRASQIKPHVSSKLNMVNSHALPIVSISEVTSTNNLITSSGQKGTDVQKVSVGDKELLDVL